MNVTVTIGRNIKDTPMKHAAWRVFKDEAYLTVKGYAPVIYFTGEGEGVWGGDTEDAYTIIFEKPVGVEILELKQGLSNLARRYNQEAIAWTEGLTQLLG